MSPIAQESERKGREGERELGEWFDRHGFSYLAISQSDTRFAKLFQGVVKRPDFLVLVDSIGLLAVDAKHRKLYRQAQAHPSQTRVFTLPLEEEFRRALLFERIFRMPVWYAYRGDDAESWYWISALKAFEVGKQCTPKAANTNGEQQPYLEIDLQQFIPLRTADDFGRLYTQRMPGYKELSKLPPSSHSPADKHPIKP